MQPVANDLESLIGPKGRLKILAIRFSIKLDVVGKLGGRVLGLA